VVEELLAEAVVVDTIAAAGGVPFPDLTGVPASS
jgi:hypothetical protein